MADAELILPIFISLRVVVSPRVSRTHILSYSVQGWGSTLLGKLREHLSVEETAAACRLRRMLLGPRVAL